MGGVLFWLLLSSAGDLAQAVRQNDVHRLASALQSGSNANARIHGEPLLLLAAARGHYVVVGHLLDAGARVDGTDRSGITPLMRAGQNGHRQTVELLVARGANINHTNVAGYTALMWTRRNGYHDIADFLVAAGAEELKSPDDRLDEPLPNKRLSKQSAAIYELLAAAKSGHKKRLDALLDSGVPIDGRNRHGETALMKATEAGRRHIVKLLVSRRADVSARDRVGYTALMVAARRNQLRIAQDLVRAGARVDARYRVGAWPADDGTALMLAAHAGHLDMVHLLLRKRANPNLASRRGDTALLYAAREGRLEAVERLLAAGADPTLCNNDGDCPRQLAADNGYHEIIELLKRPSRPLNGLLRAQPVPVPEAR